MDRQRAAATEAHWLGDRLRTVMAKDLQGGGIAGVVVQRQDGGGGLGELLAELALQLLGKGAAVEGGLGERGS